MVECTQTHAQLSALCKNVKITAIISKNGSQGLEWGKRVQKTVPRIFQSISHWCILLKIFLENENSVVNQTSFIFIAINMQLMNSQSAEISQNLRIQTEACESHALL